MAILFDVPFGEYIKMDGLNASLAVHGIKSMKSLNWARDHPTAPTDIMRIGSAAHSLLELTEHEFHLKYAIEPDFKNDPRNNSKGERSWSGGTKWVQRQKIEWLVDNPDKEILPELEYHRALEMIRSVHQNQMIRELLGAHEWHHEVVLTGEMEGVLCKARLDLLDHLGVVIADLKTTGSVDMSAFGRVFASKSYGFRLRFYQRLARENTMSATDVYALTVEQKGPFESARVPLAELILEQYDDQINRVLREYKAQVDLGDKATWPGRYDQEDAQIDIPPYSMPDAEDGVEEFRG